MKEKKKLLKGINTIQVLSSEIHLRREVFTRRSHANIPPHPTTPTNHASVTHRGDRLNYQGVGHRRGGEGGEWGKRGKGGKRGRSSGKKKRGGGWRGVGGREEAERGRSKGWGDEGVGGRGRGMKELGVGGRSRSGMILFTVKW